ncbi:MAG: acetyl CoA synthetase, partial [Thermoproteota archaeon]
MGSPRSAPRERIKILYRERLLLRSSLRGAIRISSESLRALFKPESVAVVGASAVPGRIGHAIMKNILEYGFSGVVYPVNPKYDEVMGLRCYHSVEELPGPVDMAVIAIPARLVPGVVAVLGEKGRRVAVAISSGFGEVGNRGLEEELVERARRRGMRVLGPNIFGVFYAPSRLNATFGPRDVIPGSIAFITQSGALGIALMGWTITEGIGLSALVSVGNKADIDDDDLIETLGEDESTRVIVIYMEGVRDGRRFMEAASRVSRVKPIIVVKAGRSERGRRAASSHTGALAGSDEVYSSAFRQAGVLRAGNVQEAFDWALAFSSGRTPRGDSVVIVT